MDKQIKKLLVDVLDSINNIENYIGDKKKFEEYEKDFLLQDAVERNFITIGEAVNQLLKINPEVGLTDSRRIVNLRNLLTHGYDAIDNFMVWNVLVKSLPLLRTEIENLLEG